MQVATWRKILILRNSFSSPSHPALFHSTPVSLAKWKNKWNSDARRVPEPAKNYIRYATRQKRADAKKALKDLLAKSSVSKLSFQDEDMWSSSRASKQNAEEEDNSCDYDNWSRSKKPYSRKGHRNGSKRKHKKECFSGDHDGYPETIFQATFGSRSFTWNFRPWEDSHFQSSPRGFEWRDNSNWTNHRRKVWETRETDDEEPKTVGSYSDRTTLGLPPAGPLKMEDVKSAFRASALKWHPDKHQGSSQAAAEEKFKLCVNAYNSLCSALS